MATISDDVINRLSESGYPPLTDGKVLYGRLEQFAQSAPSRIIFTGVSSSFTWTTRNVYSRSLVNNGEERKQQLSNAAIAEEQLRFEVRCWGADASGLAIDNDDVTRALVHAVIASIHSMAVGSYAIENGSFTSATFQSAQQMVSGSEYVFGATLLAPVLKTLIPYDKSYSHAPTGVESNVSDFLTTNTGTEPGCES
jgi:hypothetical protein